MGNNGVLFKPVLNNDFSTNLLFRCTPMKYAKTFLQGKIRFNQPKAWIEMEEEGNKGQGDSLEGVFLATSISDDSAFITSLKDNNEYEYFLKNDMLYFRRKYIKEQFCLCLYGLNDNMFIHKEIDKFGKDHFIAKVDKNYFSSFTKCTAEDYFKINENDRPVVLFINNPHDFFERIIRFFEKMGISRDEVLISPVDYVDLNKSFIKLVPQPMELFLKDSFFSNQSEIRIIINSNNPNLEKYMNENNNVIDIGSIEDIVTLNDNYYHDLLLEKKGNELLFTLPNPIVTELSECKLKELIAYYKQIYNDRLPYEIAVNEKNEVLDALKQVIKDKYNADILIDDSGGICLLNCDKNVIEQLNAE